ncbi:MAG: helix-turn-helix transcriptional regulator [Bacteroidota bacterium]
MEIVICDKFIHKKIGENIELLRIKRKKTPKEMAILIGLTPAGYRNIERGITEISIPKLFLTAKLLQVPYTEILNIGEHKLETLLTPQVEDLYKKKIELLKNENEFLKKQVISFHDILYKKKLS